MSTFLLRLRRALAALCVSASGVTAQQAPTPSLSPLRVAGEVGASVVGFTLGAEGSLALAAGVAYLVRGHGGDISDPRAMKLATMAIIAGAGLGASSSAWVASRINGQSSDWASNAAITTVVVAAAFRYAGWPMTRETAARRKHMSRARLLSPVWMSAIASTAVASATRRRR